MKSAVKWTPSWARFPGMGTKCHWKGVLAACMSLSVCSLTACMCSGNSGSGLWG